MGGWGHYCQPTIATCRPKSLTLDLTTANKHLPLKTATADKQLKPISAAVVALRGGPADIYIYIYILYNTYLLFTMYRASMVFEVVHVQQPNPQIEHV